MKLHKLALTGAAAAAFALTLHARVASAQEAAVTEVITDDTFEADRVGSMEGNGYTLKPGLVLHPSIGLQAGATSNVFNQAGSEGPQASGLMQLTGGLFLATDVVKPEDMGSSDLDAPVDVQEPAPRTYELRSGVQLGYREYLSGSAEVRSQRNLNVRAMTDATLFPGGPFTLTLNEAFYRDTRSANFETSPTLNRDDNRVNVGVGYRSDGGVLRSQLYYENWVQVFESGLESQFANRSNQKIGVLSSWQFLPVTKFTWDVSYGFYGPLGTSTLVGMPYKTNSHPLRVVTGLATEITSQATFKAHFGYARANYGVGEGYSAPVGGAEIGLRWSTTGRVVMLYDFDYFDSFNANFYRDSTMAAKAIQQVGSFVFDGGPELRLRHYGGIPMVFGAPERDDTVAAVTARAQWVMADRLSLSAEYRFETVQTDYRATSFDGTGNPVGLDNPSYLRHEFMVGVRAAY
jgi:hypothetical protein